jgi:hypothetical protein
MTVIQLRELAKEMKISGYSKMKKDELITAINSPPTAATPVATEEKKVAAAEKTEASSEVPLPTINWTQLQLKEQAKELKLLVSGNKSELLARILGHLKEHPNAHILTFDSPASPAASKVVVPATPVKVAVVSSTVEEKADETAAVKTWFSGLQKVFNFLEDRNLKTDTILDFLKRAHATLSHSVKKSPEDQKKKIAFVVQEAKSLVDSSSDVEETDNTEADRTDGAASEDVEELD